jgi:hypothetical protein
VKQEKETGKGNRKRKQEKETEKGTRKGNKKRKQEKEKRQEDVKLN